MEPIAVVKKKLLICGLDLETTGLDWKTGYITELGYIVKYAGAPKPAVVKCDLIYDSVTGSPVTAEIEALTKISNVHLQEWGRPLTEVLCEFLKATRDVDFFIAHNAYGFDRPWLQYHIVRCDLGHGHAVMDMTKWLDSKEDIEHTSKSTHLGYLAADHGFLNPFPHSAIFDTATMMRIVESCPLDQIIERAATPNIVVRARVGFADNALAKARRYRWQEPGNGKTYMKQWVKILKEDKLAAEVAEAKAAGFEVEVVASGGVIGS